MSKKFSASQIWTVALVLLFAFNIATTSAAPETPTRNGSSGNVTNSFIDDNLGLYLLCRGNIPNSSLKLQGRDMPAYELPRLTDSTLCLPGESSLTFPSQYTYCPGCVFTSTFSFNQKSPGANFGGSVFTSTNFSAKNFKGSNFATAVFSDANLISTQLTATNFSGSAFIGTKNKLNSANFSFANLQGASLSGVDATNANFFASHSYYSNFNSAVLSGTNFSRADLSFAVFVLADLRLTNMSGANLTSIYAQNADLRNAQLGSANLTDGSLIFAQISGTALDTANLTRANLTGAVGTPASISGAIFDNTICPDNFVATSPGTCAGHFLP